MVDNSQQIPCVRQIPAVHSYLLENLECDEDENEKKKRFLPLLWIITAPLFSIAQEARPVIAILDVTPIGVEESQSRIIYGYIIDQVLRSEIYRIVERSELEQALQEMELSSSDVIDDNMAVEIGKIAGAEFILLSTLGREGERFYLSMRVLVTETAEVVKTSVKSSGSFEEVEKLAESSVSYLLGRKAPREAERFLDVGVAFGLTLPLGTVSDVVGFGYTPTVTLGYNLAYPWGILGFGLLTGTSVTSTAAGAAVPYDLYSIPVAVRLAFSTNFAGPFFFTIEASPGAAIAILRYTDPGINENSRIHTALTFFLSAKAGIGIMIKGKFGLSVSGDFMLMTLSNNAYLGISPGVAVAYRLGKN